MQNPPPTPADAALDTKAPEPVLSIRDGVPVVEVRDRNLWAHDARTAHFYDDAELGEDRVQRIYEGVARDFWDHYAPAVATEHGYSAVWAHGRSSGWLSAEGAGNFLKDLGEVTDDPWSAPTPTPDPDPVFAHDDYYGHAYAQRDRFLAFARAITAEVAHMGDVFAEYLAEALDDLERRREACIVRSVN